MSSIGVAATGISSIAGAGTDFSPDSPFIKKYEGQNREEMEVVRKAGVNYLKDPSRNWEKGTYEYQIQQRTLWITNKNRKERFTYGETTDLENWGKIKLDKSKPPLTDFTKIINFDFGEIDLETLPLTNAVINGSIPEAEYGSWTSFWVEWKTYNYSLTVEDSNGRQYMFVFGDPNPQMLSFRFKASAYWTINTTFEDWDPGISNDYDSNRTIFYHASLDFFYAAGDFVKIIY